MIWEAIGGLVQGLAKSAVDIIDQFHMDPEEKAKFKQALVEAQIKARYEMMNLEDQDRADARKRETATGDPTTRRLAYVYTGGYFSLFVLLITGVVEVQQDMKHFVELLMMVLTTGQYSILSYYFGSSHSSSQKNATLDRVVNHNK